MSYRLPPLSAVRAFEAAARHGSFTKAAAELGMTQAAVSYQIKLLEERIGSPLFLRKPRQISLSATGEKLAPAITRAFEGMNAAFAAASGEGEDILSISTVMTFASHWLVQRLGRFQLAHPSIALRLDTSGDLVDFGRAEVDIAIRSGSTAWPGLVRHLLMKADFTPLLGPSLAATVGGISKPEDILKLPMIDPRDPWWSIWFEAAGLPSPDPGPRNASRLGSQHLEARAAMAGQGVAMLTPAFFRDEIANGQLIRPFELKCHDGHGYWLVYPEARRNVRKIRAFRDWILSEIELFEHGPV